MCEAFVKNSLLLLEYALDMTNTDFLIFQTHQQAVAEHWELPNTDI
jgi:hypothetical protein